VFLGTTILFVHLWTADERRGQAESEGFLLQDDLPAPWAGHGSSVFSLTALFSAYLASGLLFGLPAILGSASGSIAALFFVRHAIRRYRATDPRGSFDDFLSSRTFSTDRWDNVAGWTVLGMTQLGLAASELILLREIGIRGFGFTPAHAEVLALSVGLVGYFYCLLGGYLAVFRTDIAQLALVCLMGIVLVPIAASAGIRPAALGLAVDGTLWTFGVEFPVFLRHGIHVAVGLTMGFGFLISSPDCWKRVFVAERRRTEHRYHFSLLILSGILPFALLLSVLLVPRPGGEGVVLDPIALIFAAPMSHFVQMVVILGLLSSFLSTFDSALLAGTHVISIGISAAYRSASDVRNNERYWIWLGVSFLVIVLAATVSGEVAHNPFFLASFVVCGYACMGGILLGTRALSRPIRFRGLGLFLALSLLAWIFYVFDAVPNLLLAASELQMQFFASGSAVLLMVSLLAWVVGGRWKGESSGEQSPGNSR
jgi:hypothetical protein